MTRARADPAKAEPEIGLRELLATAGLAFERWLDRSGRFLARPRR
jgi:hypothetical protein